MGNAEKRLTPSPPQQAERGAPTALRSPLSPKGAREEISNHSTLARPEEGLLTTEN